MAKTLVLTFLCADGKEWNLNLARPKEGLSKATCDAAMNALVTQGIFLSAPASGVEVAYVDRTVTPVTV